MKSRKKILDKVFEEMKVDFKMRHFLKEENHPRDIVPLSFILDEEQKEGKEE